MAVLDPPALVAPTSSPRSRRRAVSPRARAVARSLGVDLSGVQGSGPGGRIVERDVRAVDARPPAPATMPVTAMATVRADAMLRAQRRLRAAGRPVTVVDLVLHALGRAVHDVLGRSGPVALAGSSSTGGGWLLIDVSGSAGDVALARRDARDGSSTGSPASAVAAAVDGSEDAVDHLTVPPVDGVPVTVGVGALAERPVAVAGQLDVRPTMSVVLTALPSSVSAAQMVDLVGHLVIALEHDLG